MIIPKFVVNYVNSCVSKDGHFNPAKAKSLLTDELQTWISQYEGYRFIHIYYLVKLGLDDIPVCPVCKKKVFNFIHGKTYCSAQCSYKDKDLHNKIKATNIERYGVDNPMKNDVVKNKVKLTNLERYGVEHALQSSEIMNKFKSTIQTKYNVEHYSKTDEFKEKCKETCTERYGFDSYFKTDEFKEKYEATCIEHYGVNSHNSVDSIKLKKIDSSIEKYGVEHYSKTDEFKERCKQTCLEHYGVEYYTQTDEYKDRSKQTCLEKYGVEHYSKTDEFKTRFRNTLLKKYGVESIMKLKSTVEAALRTKRIDRFSVLKNIILKKNIELCSTKDEFINGIFKYTCKICGTNFDSKYSRPIKVKCPVCSKYHLRSSIEDSLFIWLEDNKIDSIKNNRTILNGKEIDIFIPSKNVAIEFNGTYWHSDRYLNNLYHYDKTNIANNKGIKLIHIFEHEYKFKHDIIMSLLNHSLNRSEIKIDARKCIFKEISRIEYDTFMNENNLYGTDDSSYRYGLFYHNELVVAIGLSYLHNNNSYKLNRYCSKNFTIVRGGFSKIIKNFISLYKCKTIISYIDRCKFNGYSYQYAGFMYSETTNPMMQLVGNNFILYENRNKIDTDLINKCTKIYDSGSFVYVYRG